MKITIGTISAGYGVISKVHPNGHTGIDYAVPLKTPLHAPYDGVVSSIRDYGNASLGKAVFVQKADGTQYVLGHLSEIKVKIGQSVEKGDLLALSGSSGRSTGPHLHYGEFATNGNPIDPGNVPYEAFQSAYPDWTQWFVPLLEKNEQFFQNWFHQDKFSMADTLIDMFITFLPVIVTFGLIYLGFKLMLSPLWK